MTPEEEAEFMAGFVVTRHAPINPMQDERDNLQRKLDSVRGVLKTWLRDQPRLNDGVVQLITEIAREL